MKNIIWLISLAAALLAVSSCDRKNEDLIMPISLEDFPQQLILDEEEGGEVEDSDEMSFVISLTDRFDPSGEELAGEIFPLQENVTLYFRISDSEGFENLEELIHGGYAFYEIDDCTTSEDKGEDLGFTLDLTTGTGSVTFPAGVEEIEIVLELNEALFDDEELNSSERGFTVQLTAVEPATEKVVVNTERTFTYSALDDETVFGEWELEVDPEQFPAFQQLFSLVEPSLAELVWEDVDEIEAEFSFDELEFTVVLKEEEEVEECGETSMENKEISFELEYDKLEEMELEGEIALLGELEMEDGSTEEVVFSGSFSRLEENLVLKMSGTLDDEETEESQLTLSR